MFKVFQKKSQKNKAGDSYKNDYYKNNYERKNKSKSRKTNYLRAARPFSTQNSCEEPIPQIPIR